MKNAVATNLEVLKPSRRAPVVGDIFVFRPAGRGYFFGRVVRTDAKIRYGSDGILIYLFSIESDVKYPPEHLPIMRLLVPPVMTNRLPWSRGYFETVAHRGFVPGERLPVHCFYSAATKSYLDDDANELSERREPCGTYGLGSFRTIDDEVSDALGMPRVPD